jgi:hypothetical protein
VKQVHLTQESPGRLFLRRARWQSGNQIAYRLGAAVGLATAIGQRHVVRQIGPPQASPANGDQRGGNWQRQPHCHDLEAQGLASSVGGMKKLKALVDALTE